MKKWTKITLIVSLCFIGAGAAVSFAGYAMNGYNMDLPEKLRFRKTSTDIKESFTKVNIYSVNESVELLPSESDQCYIECYDSEKMTHDISVKDDILDISANDNRNWYETIFSSFEAHKITVFIPVKEYESIHIETVNGNITSDDKLTLENITLKTTNGNIKPDSKLNGEVHAKSVNGNIDVNNIENAGYVDLKTTNGNINVSGKNADELDAETVNGNISAELTVKGMAQITTVNGGIDTNGLSAGKIYKYAKNGRND